MHISWFLVITYSTFNFNYYRHKCFPVGKTCYNHICLYYKEKQLDCVNNMSLFTNKICNQSD